MSSIALVVFVLVTIGAGVPAQHVYRANYFSNAISAVPDGTGRIDKTFETNLGSAAPVEAASPITDP